MDATGLVLLPGAGLGPELWDELRPHLDAPALAVRYPGEGTLADYVAAAAAQVEGWEHARVVLVAHSLGGVVGMRLAAHLGDRVAGFIGISAAIPINGGSFVSALPFPQKVIVRLMLRLAGTRPPDAAIRKGLCSDLTTEQADQIVARFTPESRAVYTDRVDVAPPDVPRRYVVLTADREFPPSLQARFARRLGGNQIELDSGHLPMVSQPGELAKLLARFLSDAVAP